MLEALETFLAVAEAGSFSRVARAEGTAVSSVLRRINQLEAELHVPLFHRSSRRLVLTDAGEKFVPQARHLVAAMAEAKVSLRASEDEPEGLLTVTAPATFGRRCVVPALLSLAQRHSRLQVDLHLSDEVLDLSVRRVDVAIRLGRRPSSDLMTTQLAPVHRLVCASPEYLERRGRPRTPLDLVDHECLTIASGPTPTGWWSFADVNRERPLSVSGRFRSDDTGTLVQAALAGLGIVHLATWLVSDLVVTGRLVSLFPDATPPRRERSVLQAVRMPGRSHAARARLLIAHLRQTFGTPPYWDRALGLR